MKDKGSNILLAKNKLVAAINVFAFLTGCDDTVLPVVIFQIKR